MVHRFSFLRIGVVLMAAAISLSAFGDGRGKGFGSTIDFTAPGIPYDSVKLTISFPNGDTLSREYVTGRPISLRVADLGTDVPDGQYNFEVVVTPKLSSDVKKKLQNARAANDDAAARKIMREAGLSSTGYSGTFSISGGSIVDTEATEGNSSSAGESSAMRSQDSTDAVAQPRGGKVAVNDQVIPDDLIVQGSTCVGFDCVNNESFGFDTIRLKENNLRIKAEDTSTGSFPTNDWQLTFNDSASGGSSKFSVEDITGSKVPMTITAGASTNSIFVDSTGRVGFRTSTPVLDLHVATSNTPAIRLEQNSSGGFTAQTWDIAGNEANFFVRDVTSGSRLPFRIRPGAPTSSVDISADGDVGVGTASPNANSHLDVSDSTQLKARIALTGQEFYQAGNTSTDGVAILLGVNRTNNRQIWFGDTAALAQNGTNPLIRFYPYNGEISAIATDGATPKDLKLNASGGNVGIGTSSPISRLHVNGGDIRVSGGSFIDDGTTLNVPDYVFDETYKLMSLPELETFIRENKHLPNVPSASKVKNSGLNISEMQMRLLEKVEELTLYTLNQNKTITDLRAENDALAARLKALEEQR